MTKHPTHRIHQHSREAYRTIEPKTREQQVLSVLRERCEPMTDRQIAYALGSQDMNYARPAITNLIHSGKLREVSKTVCETTGRKVRCVFYAWVLGGDA